MAKKYLHARIKIKGQHS